MRVPAALLLATGLGLAQSPSLGWEWVPMGSPAFVTEASPQAGPPLIRVTQSFAVDDLDPALWLRLDPWAPGLIAPTHPFVPGDLALITGHGAAPPWVEVGNGAIVTPSQQVWKLNLAHPGLTWLNGGSVAPVLAVLNGPAMEPNLDLNALAPEVPHHVQAWAVHPAAPTGIVLSEPAAFLPTRKSASATIPVPRGAAVPADLAIRSALPTTTWHTSPGLMPNVFPGPGWWLNGNGLLTRGAALPLTTPDATLLATIPALGSWGDFGPVVHYTVSVGGSNIEGGYLSRIEGPGWALTAFGQSMWAYGSFQGSISAPSLIVRSAGSGPVAPVLPLLGAGFFASHFAGTDGDVDLHFDWLTTPLAPPYQRP